MDDPARTTFHDALAKSDNAATRALADVVVGQTNGQLTCWGDLADYVRAHFQSDADSLALWQVLTAVGDRRPELLFLDIHRARPTVLRALLSNAQQLAPLVQCALVSMPEAEPLLPTATETLGPAARELVAAAPTIRAQERVTYETHMTTLRSQRASVAYSDAAVAQHLAELVVPLRGIAAGPILGAAGGAAAPSQPAAPTGPAAAGGAPAEPLGPRAAEGTHLIAEAGQALRPGGTQ